MKPNDVRLFFEDCGIPMGCSKNETIPVPLCGRWRGVYTAEPNRVIGRPCAALFFIRTLNGSDKLGTIRADTVILGETVLQAVDFWRPRPKGRAKPMDHWVMDKVEVEYTAITALHYRRVGLTAQDVRSTGLWKT